ncbi:hypothetical protein SETIT_9G237600v2 [Setaria italica]|uniref:Uncharacterized protein n=1 Tax=Setaria italica TaxID=4555 RepID=K4AH33_SETIT|nr:hypothetical protein SETIT_9G237600v2 [Setaria italica]
MRGLRQMVSGHAVASRAPWMALQGKGRRRRKMAVARLGGDVRPRRRFLGTALRRLHLRWRLAAMYRRALRRLRAACASGAVQRILESAALVGAARLDAGF